MGDLAVRLQSLQLYPIKSCAAAEVRQALLIETGLELDRAWMVVDTVGEALGSSERPALAEVKPTLRTDDMALRAPGMLTLHVALDAVEKPTVARLHGRRMAAYDMGDLSAQWFSDYLGRRVRLVRFDPDAARDAPNAFQDAHPLLLAASASLDEAGRRRADEATPAGPAGPARFRVNLVVDGLAAGQEDALEALVLDAPDGPIRLQRVGSYPVCPTSPSGGTAAEVPADSNGRSAGAIPGYGVYLDIVEGIDRVVQVGVEGVAQLRI